MKTSSENRLERILRATVRERMVEKEMTLRALSRAADVPLGTLHNWLGSSADRKKHDGRPRFAVVVSVAEALKLNLDDVVRNWRSTS